MLMRDILICFVTQKCHLHCFLTKAGMQAAEASLRELNIYEPDPAIYSAVLSKVRRASLDCYIHQVRLYVVLLFHTHPNSNDYPLTNTGVIPSVQA